MTRESEKKHLKYPAQKDFEQELKVFCRGLSEDKRSEISRRIYNSSMTDLEARTFAREDKMFLIQSPFIRSLLADGQIFFTSK